MDFTYLFTSLQGRVSRAKWWAGEASFSLSFPRDRNQTPIGPAISALAWIMLPASLPPCREAVLGSG